MASGAKDPTKRQVVPIQLVAAEDKDPAIQEISDGVVPPADLPVPKQVEDTSPTFPVVEETVLSSRVELGSSIGQQNKQPNQKHNQPSPLGAKGSAAQIFSAAVPRGESLAKFSANSGDAQSSMEQRETLGMVDSKTPKQSDQLLMGTPPFSTDESMIMRERGCACLTYAV